MHELLTELHHVVTLVFHTLDMLYQSLLLIGAIGVAAQAALGFSHGHGAHGGHGHGGADVHGGGPHHAHGVAEHAAVHGDGPVHAHAPAQGSHAHHADGKTDQSDGRHDGRAGDGIARVFTLLSPLTVFSFFMGIGLTGLLVRSYLSPIPAGLVATAGGIAFYRLLVRPMWGVVLRFASKPAETLRGAVATDAEALSRFDTQGRGMVRITVDGEVKSLLAYLEPEDTKQGIVVSPGDRLVVTGVDEKKNTCRVTRL
jgi:hypothetical protein